MEDQNAENVLQFCPPSINWTANFASGLVHGPFLNHPYTMTPESNGMISQVPVPMPQWMYGQQTPQDYVEYLVENGCYPDIPKQPPYGVSSQVPSLGQIDPSQLEEYMKILIEGNSITNFTAMGHHFGVQKQDLNEDQYRSFQVDSGSTGADSNHPSEARRKRSREKAYAADRCRRLKISYWLDALQELLPHSGGGGKVGLLNDVIDHVKNLQYQLKNLCQTRLGGESTAHSVTFSEMLNGPLEEVMGKLVEANPSVATELLRSKGLVVMPMIFAERLHEPIEMLDMQGGFLASK